MEMEVHRRGVNLYGLSVSRTDFCDLHGLTYGHTMQSLRIFMIFADSHLQSFHSLYSNCCEFAMTPSMLHEVKHASAAYPRGARK